MSIPWEHFGVIAGFGALGGLVQSTITGFQLPSWDNNAKIFQFGSVGRIFAGAVAAAVVWCLYGPLASVSTAPGRSFEANIPPLHFAFSVLVGLSGGEILRREAQKMNLMGQKEAEKEAKIALAETLKDTLAAEKEAEGEAAIRFLQNPEDTLEEERRRNDQQGGT